MISCEIAISSDYSEPVVRAAVAWAAPHSSKLEIKKIGDGWLLQIQNAPEDIESTISQYLNEARLREIIDDQTGLTRKLIIQRALENIVDKLKKNDASN